MVIDELVRGNFVREKKQKRNRFDDAAPRLIIINICFVRKQVF